MSILKLTEEIFYSYCQSEDMEDFHNLQGKLVPLTLSRAAKAEPIFPCIFPNFTVTDSTPNIITAFTCIVSIFHILKDQFFERDLDSV